MAALSLLLLSSFQVIELFGASYGVQFGRHFWLLFVVAVLSLTSKALTGYALSRDRPWAWILALIIAFMGLATLMFPFSLAIGWYLLPDVYRDRCTNLIKGEIAAMKR